MAFRDILMMVASSPPRASSPVGPVELFPDPTLADVADGTNGWDFNNASPGVLEPTGGTGPGITLTACDDGWSCNLIGTDAAEFLSNVAIGASINVALTIAGFSAGACQIGVRGDATTFAPSGNGVISHTLTAGASTEESTAFSVTGGGTPGTFQITDISVTAA